MLFSFELLSFCVIIRSYSSDASLVVPIKSYSNTDTQKLEIFQDNKGKSGIYRWVNNINGKCYVGSAVNITNRLYQYFSAKRLMTDNMAINKAILKYGYSNFSFEILEYCSVEELLKREQFYFDLLSPEYNILKIAGSSLGYKHSLDNILKFSNAKKGEKNPMFGKTHSEETREKKSKAMKGKTHSKISIQKMIEARGTAIYLYSLDSDNKLNQLLNIFPSSQVAAKELECSDFSIRKYARSNYIFQNQYILSLEPLTSAFKAFTNKFSRHEGIIIYIYSLDGQLIESFTSATKAGLYLKLTRQTIMNYAHSNKILKNKFILSLKELSPSSFIGSSDNLS